MITDEGNGPPLFNNDIDLDQPALSEFDGTLLTTFNAALDSDTMTTCDMCDERWFDQDLRDLTIDTVVYTNVCRLCRNREADKNKKQGAPPLMSAGNRIDPGPIDHGLDEPTIVEEMLIARVHIQVECFQIRGQQ